MPGFLPSYRLARYLSRRLTEGQNSVVILAELEHFALRTDGPRPSAKGFRNNTATPSETYKTKLLIEPRLFFNVNFVRDDLQELF